ncbi:Uncharacterised protein [Burkholderia pseudomallei]|nr:Uncharacterised protein [Burkholderia pseudomallei]
MTTDNSRADALTDAQIIDLIYECDIPPYCELAAIDFARRLLLAVSQPVAAPIVSAPASDARECLMDVVSHHHDFVTACKSIKGELHACGAHDSAAYWQKQIDVLDRMKAQAERALATSANETGAEGAQKEAVMLLLQARDELCLIEWEGEDPPERIHTLFDKIEAFVTRSPAMAAEALAEEHSTIECQAHSGPDCTECGGTGVWSGKADERAASWHCEDPVQKCRAQCDSCAKQARAALKAIVDERAECIAWANANGFTKYHESMCAAWEERARRAAQQLSAEIRELKVKLGSYEREREDQIRYLAAQSEEIAGLKQQLAHADARVGLTATVIQKCIDSCAAEYLEDVTGHPEDAAYCQGITDCIDALNRLKTADWSAILAAHSGQSEPETATVARIEQLRKALFESRDAMRVMSNWVKKSDPAGHSWAVRMVDRANAALNGEPEPRAEVMLFADNDERDEFIRVCQDFDDDGETCVDYELLMKWASNGLLDCDHFTITKKGRAAIDAARTGASS